MLPHDLKCPTDIRHPRPVGICDRCGQKYYLDDLPWAYDWRGNELANLRLRVSHQCLDVPNEQLRPIIIGPDPTPILDARPYYYAQQNAAPTPAIPDTGPVGNFVLDDGMLGEGTILGGGEPTLP